MTRQTIINQLISDIKKYIHPTNGYNIDVREVLRGVYTYDDTPNKPAVCVWNYKDEPYTVSEFGQLRHRLLRLYMYLYIDLNYDTQLIHDFVADLENFLYKDFTYKDTTTINDITIYEGGVTDPAGIAEIDVEILYEMEVL